MTPRAARRVRWLLALAIVPLGLAAEHVGFPAAALQRAALDLVVGWLLVGCGSAVWARRPDSRTGLLLVCVGYAWFTGNFAALPAGTAATLADRAAFLFWGFLVHTLLTYPTGRTVDPLERVAIPVAYGLSLLPGLWRTDLGPIGLALALAATLVVDRGLHSIRGRRMRLPAFTAGLVIALVTGMAPIVPGLAPAGGTVDSGVLVTTAMGLVALMLATGMLGLWSRGADLTDLLVELGEGPGGVLADALARALDDPTLEVGFWAPGPAAHLDAAGRPIVAPEPGGSRAATQVDRDGEPVALLTHDPSLLADPQLRASISGAAVLAASNARLRAEVFARVDELQSSRRRLVEAQDAERRALEERLQEGAARRLDELAAIVRSVPPGATAALSGADRRLAVAAAEVGLTHAELDELARGLHPRVLTEQGLDGALRDLASRSPVAVEVTIDEIGRPLPDDVAATVWFVCSEALANVAKYAAASSRVALFVRVRADAIALAITDDGPGGADVARGTGLSGLMDRVAALGGALTVDSPPGRGTYVAASIPSGGDVLERGGEA